MNSTQLAQLIEEWTRYTSEQKNCSIHDFAAWLLTQQMQSRNKADGEEVKLKLLELSRILEIQTKKAFGGNGNELQILQMLTAIDQLGTPHKLDAISASLMEISTGFALIKKLVKKKLVAQRTDNEDGRAYIIYLTTEGKSVLAEKKKKLKKVMLFSGVSSTSDQEKFTRIINTLHKVHKKDIIQHSTSYNL